MKYLVAIASLTALLATNGFADDAQKKVGESIYQQYCSVCHAPTSSVPNSPKSEADWKKRFENAKTLAQKNNPKATDADAMDQLVTSVKNGKGAMPPGGTCPKTTCKSDDDYKSAIKYMMGDDKEKKNS